MTERVDTGIMEAWTDPETIREGEGPGFTVAVIVPAEPVPPPPTAAELQQIKAAKQALIKLPDLTHHELAKLAQEVAMDIKPLHDIIKVYNLTHGQYEFMLETVPFFKHALETALIEWNSALSTAERIKVEAAHALEDTLPALAARMGSKTESLNHAVEAGKLFAKLAGLDQPDAKNKAPGERFTITINLGSDQSFKHETKTINATATEGGASSGSTTLRVNTEGA